MTEHDTSRCVKFVTHSTYTGSGCAMCGRSETEHTSPSSVPAEPMRVGNNYYVATPVPAEPSVLDKLARAEMNEGLYDRVSAEGSAPCPHKNTGYLNKWCLDCGKSMTAETTPSTERTNPKIVCLCGSTRFFDYFQRANYEFTMAGKIVLSVGFYPHSQKQAHGEDVGCSVEQKIALDALHKRKIDLADEIFVLNVGGYIGSSTRSEIEYAEALGRPVLYLETPQPLSAGGGKVTEYYGHCPKCGELLGFGHLPEKCGENSFAKWWAQDVTRYDGPDALAWSSWQAGAARVSQGYERRFAELHAAYRQAETERIEVERQLTEAREALRRMAVQDSECQCNHDTEDCCNVVGEWCYRCIAGKALRKSKGTK